MMKTKKGDIKMGEMPNPQTVRDLRLMYETTANDEGTVEYKKLKEAHGIRDYHEGDIVDMSLRVVPSTVLDRIEVYVERTRVTNISGNGYTPEIIVDWRKEYDFDGFKKSPFYQMCIDAWTSYNAPSWDTHLMDEHDVQDNYTNWWVSAHVYEHSRDWLGNWKKTGSIDYVTIELDDDGSLTLYHKHDGHGNYFFSGDIWELRDIVHEHAEMKEKLGRLKEHGIGLDEGTLSIKLWDEE